MKALPPVWSATIGALVFGASLTSCGPKSEWQVDARQQAELEKTLGKDSWSDIRVWKASDGGTASAMFVAPGQTFNGKSLRDVARDRLERFREYRSGPPLRESAHVLFASGARGKGSMVVAYVFSGGYARYVALELPSPARWESRLADFVHNRLDSDVPQDEITNAKTVSHTASPQMLESPYLGTVPLPAEWFEMTGEGMASPLDPIGLTRPSLVLPDSNGFVYVQAVRPTKGLPGHPRYGVWRPFNPGEMREGVNVLAIRERNMRKFVVRHGDVFVMLTETDGPVRNKVTSTEELAKYFDALLRNRGDVKEP